MSANDGDAPLYYRKHVFMCTNEREAGHPRGCCKEKGADDVRNYMKAKAKALGLKDVRINAAGCLDRCELGISVVVYPEGVWYTVSSFEDADEILEKHLVEGGRATRLLMPAEDPKH
ncbi:MAG: (2Fe-2S) ferredoxin domain-containing protein [Alphaproteobacteria bacterium]|nr:(2Fe-2S) ferredoxin domain-containing protein [Alphaproteobacteria bacterium]